MKQIDPLCTLSDEQLMMEHIFCNDPELLLLDTILSECFYKKVD